MHPFFLISNPQISEFMQGLSGWEFFSATIPSFIVIGLIIGVVIFFFIFLFGGVQWITSGGNKQSIEIARDRITQGFIGIFLLLFIFALIRLINSFFNINIGNLGVPEIPTPAPTRVLTPTSIPNTCECYFGRNTIDNCTAPATAICTTPWDCQCEQNWTGAVIVRNEASGQSCDYICAGMGLNCVNVGMGNGANDGFMRIGDIPGCRNYTTSCAGTMISTGVIDGSPVGVDIECNWTHCRCE